MNDIIKQRIQEEQTTMNLLDPICKHSLSDLTIKDVDEKITEITEKIHNAILSGMSTNIISQMKLLLNSYNNKKVELSDELLKNPDTQSLENLIDVK